MSPLDPEIQIIPKLTNSTGMITLDNLKFTSHGIAGYYRLSFACDGVMNVSENI